MPLDAQKIVSQPFQAIGQVASSKDYVKPFAEGVAHVVNDIKNSRSENLTLANAEKQSDPVLAKIIGRVNHAAKGSLYVVPRISEATLNNGNNLLINFAKPVNEINDTIRNARPLENPRQEFIESIIDTFSGRVNTCLNIMAHSNSNDRSTMLLEAALLASIPLLSNSEPMLTLKARLLNSNDSFVQKLNESIAGAERPIDGIMSFVSSQFRLMGSENHPSSIDAIEASMGNDEDATLHHVTNIIARDYALRMYTLEPERALEIPSVDSELNNLAGQALDSMQKMLPLVLTPAIDDGRIAATLYQEARKFFLELNCMDSQVTKLEFHEPS